MRKGVVAEVRAGDIVDNMNHMSRMCGFQAGEKNTSTSTPGLTFTLPGCTTLCTSARGLPVDHTTHRIIRSLLLPAFACCGALP